MSAPLPPPLNPVPSQSKPTPGLATASLILGIVSILGAAILVVPTILAIVFGHMAHAKIRKDPALGGAGVAITGFVLGYASIIFGIITVGLLAAMAIPAFQKVRDNAYVKTMENDARQIAGAAQQVMLQTEAKTVTFTIDPATGAVGEPLTMYVDHITKGTEAVDNVIGQGDNGFSLRNPKVKNGAVQEFDTDGAPLN